jgi:AcrR family transcriptional regulator
MNGFAKRKQQSKEDIRRAAGELFSQFGVDRVSMADIARKAGVSQATIYNNFENKEALTREFVSTAVSELISQVRVVLETPQNYHDKMEAFFQFISRMLANNKPNGEISPVFSGSIDLQSDPEMMKIRAEAQEQMIGLLLVLAEEGRQQSQINPQITDATLVLYFTAFMDLFSGSGIQQRAFRNPKLVLELGNLMMFGLQGPR